jgi:two-component system chemotaxis response regulator CheB
MFSGSFANRLNANSAITVQEVTEDKVQLLEGHAYLAPGDKHLTIARRGPNLYAFLDDRPTVNRHKPSVDVMFETAAEVAKDKVIGVILTGMGQDGAKGLLDLKQSGSYTIAQDQASSVVWGMPRVAVEMNAAASVVSLLQIPHQICHYLSREA